MEFSVAGFLEVYLKSLCGKDADEYVRRLDDAIAAPYASWLAINPHLLTLLNKSEKNLAHPRDVVSFLLDHELPNALRRKHSSPTDRIKELRQLARELDEDAYICLLGVYAARKGDRRGLRRAWDVFTNLRSPYRPLFSEFRARSRGAKARGSLPKSERNMKIIVKAFQLERDGKPRHEINGILAREFELSSHQIRNIRKKT